MKKPREFVLDGSVAMAWYFADESNPYADAILTDLETGRALVPSLWPLEVVNTVLETLDRSPGGGVAGHPRDVLHRS
ncbi:type II toxin-antitoxin system VapC family toxin [Singulisphaera acidiphila]|uniref:type II toxin-antitoxin system VapC family toxin n=1 Tax=Singulisphaera acidiphila TaxID=466153 RepID=UPI0002473188|nr:type II toxin-antitoxin system VapC family toxin [Singulisphaera acidiphila]